MKGRTGQRGATLLEFILGTAVSAVVVVGLVGLIIHEFRGSATANTSITAAQEISNAAHLLNEDGMTAESTDLIQGAEPVAALMMLSIDRSSYANIPHYCSYYLEGTDLIRDHDGDVMTVARNISSIEFSQDGRMITVSISCTPQWGTDRTIRETYRVYLRPQEQG